MKRLIFIFLFIASIVSGQTIGDTTSVWSTSGWDVPHSFISPPGHYDAIKYFDLLSQPGGWINWNYRAVDSLLYALVVYTDTTQLHIENDTLKFSPNMCGSNEFYSTESVDTLVIPGYEQNDVVMITPIVTETLTGPNLDQIKDDGIIKIKHKDSDTVLVYRYTTGDNAANLKYNWLWIKRR